jgi:hypothetical protein
MMNRTLAPWVEPDRLDARSVRSGDGALVVTMQRTSHGIFVERVIQRPGTSRVVQDVVFGTADQFRRWCDADRARFDYPLLYANLARHADALFSANTDSGSTG